MLMMIDIKTLVHLPLLFQSMIKNRRNNKNKNFTNYIQIEIFFNKTFAINRIDS